MLSHSPSKLDYITDQYDKTLRPVRHKKVYVQRNFQFTQKKVQNVYNNQDLNFQEKIVKQLQKNFGRHEATSLLKQREEEGSGMLVGETEVEQLRRSASHLGDESV